MTDLSDIRAAVPATRRRTALLLFAGVFAGLGSRPARSHPAASVQTLLSNPSGFRDLKTLGPAHQVRTLSHAEGIFCVTTSDGRTADFLETDLRFKVDTSSFGPSRGQPMILPAGTIGDRAWVFFATPGEISRFITDQG